MASDETACLGVVERVDAVSKVTGRARYTDDIQFHDLLYSAVLRSPHASARIKSIDVTAAKGVAGVHAVLTGKDVPAQKYGRMCRDIPILCTDVVRFAGDKVAAVVATSQEACEEALAVIHVDYEETPAVFDAEKAMAETAPHVHSGPQEVAPNPADRLHGTLRMYPGVPNVISEMITENGHPIEAMQQADLIFEGEYEVPSVHQGYLEPHSVVVSIGNDGIVDIWASNKAPHVVRGIVGRAINVEEDKIRLNPVVIGGDFGGKGSPMDIILCYFLAKEVRRPVRMVMSYHEELIAGNPRHSAKIYLKTGVNRDGSIQSIIARMIFNSGAYAGFSPVATVHGYIAFAGPYYVPNVSVSVYRVYTNTVPAGHMRSPGGPQITFALESHLDSIAHAIDMDPLAFRELNAIRDGQRSPFGEQRRDLACIEVIAAGAKAFNWDRQRGANIGKGVALYEYPPGSFGRSTVQLSIADGIIHVLLGSPDTGTGFHSAMRQLAARHLQLEPSFVHVSQGDTLVAGFESGASGSRLTTTVGQAIFDAASKLLREIASIASERLNCSGEDLKYSEGKFMFGERTWTIFDLVDWAEEQGRGPFRAIGHNTPNEPADITNFAAQFAEVEVDRDTGQIKVTHVVTAHDVGTIINPVLHQGQIEGGLIQVFGQATCEALVLDSGNVVTAHLGDYKLPTMADIPPLTTVLVSVRGSGPYDVKAIAEMSNAALPAAIANAIYDAVGARITRLPLTANIVYEASRPAG